MKKNITTYFHTNIYETTSGNFATDLLKFHMGQIGLDRILYSVDYPYVSLLSSSLSMTHDFVVIQGADMAGSWLARHFAGSVIGARFDIAETRTGYQTSTFERLTP